MELPVKNFEGEVVGSVELDDNVWGVPMNGAVLHQVVVAQQANRRQGTQDTKTRSDATYSTAKLRSQKHTGRARQGSRSSALLGNSVALGPHPRDHRKRVPTKMRRLALRIALSDKVRESRVAIVDSLEFSEPRTKRVKELIANLEAGGPTLIIGETVEAPLLKSVRNLPGVEVMPSRMLSVIETVRTGNLILTLDAAKRINRDMSQMVGKPEAGVAAS